MTYKIGQNNKSEPEKLYKTVDGRRVEVARFIVDKKHAHRRLDAPYGYPRRMDFGSGVLDNCMIYVMQHYDNTIDRYALISHPASDPLVSFRCRKI
jgi:hypothetical protein